MPIVPPSPEHLAAAARALEAGELVIVPTETVYGIAADATNPLAVAKIFAAKGRPHFNPLIAHVPGHEEAARHAELNVAAHTLIEAFWPGPLTIVAPRRADSSVCDLACAGLVTIALRAPAHPVARALLGMLEFPLAAPSANRSGHLSATRAADADEDLGASVALTLDGGQTPHGLESTIVALVDDTPRLLRLGAVPVDAIETHIGPLARARDGDPVSAPGMLTRHYAPRARLRLNASAAEPGERYLGFGPASGAPTLSATGDLTEAAANLFSALRALDSAGAEAIAVAPIPETGLGEAINDRLRRAAQGR